MHELKELELLLRKKFKINEMVTDKFIILYCYYDFEPFGRASETFELVWELWFPTIPYYWHSTIGWKLGKAKDLGMGFRGRNPESAIEQAITFLNEVEVQ